MSKVTFQTFLGWVYDGKVVFKGGKSLVDEDTMMEAIELYMFANFHGTIGLRRACIDLIVEALNGKSSLREGRPITYRQAEHIWKNLSESSGLHRLAADSFVYNKNLSTEIATNEFLERIPKPILVRRLRHLNPTRESHYFITPRGTEMIDTTIRILQPCDYHEHEHESEEEERACAGYGKYPPPSMQRGEPHYGLGRRGGEIDGPGIIAHR